MMGFTNSAFGQALLIDLLTIVYNLQGAAQVNTSVNNTLQNNNIPMVKYIMVFE